MEKNSNPDNEVAKLLNFLPEKSLQSILNYKAKPGEIYIVTYPKCGTTWMHYIVLLILRKGKLPEDPLDFFLGCPFIEMIGTDYIEKSKPKAMKTHLPYSVVPYSDEAKYIYVARNPKDCCVSYYYHMKFMPFKDMDFDKFFDQFMKGELGYGDYFDHLLEWYQHRNDKNVYFVTYERLKKDIRGEILKLSKFLGDEYEKCILEDSDMLERMVNYSNFEHMKKDTKKSMEMFLSEEDIFAQRDVPEGLLEIRKKFKESRKADRSGAFVRKGIVGDWKNHFNEDQIKLLDEKIAEKTKDSDVMNLWNDI